jgi:hypothetical protein
MKTKTKPSWLYLKSYVAEELFFLKKWISSVCSRKSNSLPVSDEYTRLIQSASRFIAKNLFKYTKGFLILPLNALKLWSMFKKEKEPSKDILDEILNPNIRSQIKGELDDEGLPKSSKRQTRSSNTPHRT